MKYLFTFIAIYIALGIHFFNPTTDYFLKKNHISFSSDTTPNSIYTPTEITFDDKTAFQTLSSTAELPCLTDDATQLAKENDIQKTILSADIESEIAKNETRFFQFTVKPENHPTSKRIDYWTTLYSIESKQGNLLYRPRNKHRSCSNTAAPCGHHQLSLQALKDISCTTRQCKKDRENFTKSLAMSKKLQKINQKRLLKAGYSNLPDYQQYLIHQQGANGFKTIIAASQGKKTLSRNIKMNMSGNSPYSYKKLKKMGSKLAAQNFLKYWDNKWKKENKLIIAKQNHVVFANNTLNTNNMNINNDSVHIKDADTISLPLFNKDELLIALNIKI